MGKVRYKVSQPVTPSPPVLNIPLPPLRGQATQEVHSLSLSSLQPFVGQARKRFKDTDLAELQQSIHHLGVITPLLVAKTPEQGHFYVINGERRLRAAKALGLEKVPCLILAETSNIGWVALTDNVQRVNLHPLELAEGCEALIQSHGDVKKVAEKLGIPYTSLVETLKLRLLPQRVQHVILNRNITSRSILRQIMKQPSEEAMMTFLKLSKASLELPKKKVIDVFLQGGRGAVVFSRYRLNAAEKRSLAEVLRAEAQRLEASAQADEIQQG